MSSLPLGEAGRSPGRSSLDTPNVDQGPEASLEPLGPKRSLISSDLHLPFRGNFGKTEDPDPQSRSPGWGTESVMGPGHGGGGEGPESEGGFHPPDVIENQGRSNFSDTRFR